MIKNNSFKRILILPFVFLPLSTIATPIKEQSTTPSQPIPAFSAKYSVLHKSDPVGYALRELSYQDDGTINYHYKTDVEWFIFSQVRAETSILTLDNNKVIPQHYTYSRKGTGKDKNYEWYFDAENNTAEDLGRKRKPITLDFSSQLQDKLSYHLQHRLNLLADAKQQDYSYSVVSTSGTVKEYVYQYDGKEELILPYGMVKTVRFKREVKEKERVTYAWFAPELDYLLVKLYQSKGGTEQFEAQLSSVTYANK